MGQITVEKDLDGISCIDRDRHYGLYADSA